MLTDLRNICSRPSGFDKPIPNAADRVEIHETRRTSGTRSRLLLIRRPHIVGKTIRRRDAGADDDRLVPRRRHRPTPEAARSGAAAGVRSPDAGAAARNTSSLSSALMDLPVGIGIAVGPAVVRIDEVSLVQVGVNDDGHISVDACAALRESTVMQVVEATVRVLEGEEAGALVRLEVAVLDQTEIVGGVTTRVVQEREWVNGALIELSRNFYAEATDGTVCYFGEEVDIYENGQIISHEGAWRADAPGNRPGIIMPADPQPGMMFQMEGAPGVAEDQGTIKSSGRIRVPAGSFSKTIRVEEFNPLDGGSGRKVFAKGVGLVVDPPVALVTFQVP